MAQIRIYGRHEHLNAHRDGISKAIHRSAMDALG